MGKLRQHATPAVSALAKEIVSLWKDKVGESKRKRKLEEDKGGDDSVKRVKADGGAAGSSAAASPAASTPGAGGAGTATAEGSKPNSKGAPPKSPMSPTGPQPLSTIDSSRTTPRTAKEDAVATTIRADGEPDDIRDKCAVLMYDALAIDSNATKTVLVERAVSIENEVYKLMSYQSGNEYRGSESGLNFEYGAELTIASSPIA